MHTIKIKGIYKHFKGDYYIVEDIATNCDDDSLCVIYRALYGDNKLYVRPLESFTSLVDINKYPNTNQTYRFELQEIKSVKSN